MAPPAFQRAHDGTLSGSVCPSVHDGQNCLRLTVHVLARVMGQSDGRVYSTDRVVASASRWNAPPAMIIGVGADGPQGQVELTNASGGHCVVGGPSSETAVTRPRTGQDGQRERSAVGAQSGHVWCPTTCPPLRFATIRGPSILELS